MTIINIDYHVDDHLIQVGQGMMRIFIDGNTKKEPIEFNAIEIEQILRVSRDYFAVIYANQAAPVAANTRGRQP